MFGISMLYLEKRFAGSSSLVATFKVTTCVFPPVTTRRSSCTQLLTCKQRTLMVLLDAGRETWWCHWKTRGFWMLVVRKITKQQIYCRTIPFCIIRRGAAIQTICLLAWCFFVDDICHVHSDPFKDDSSWIFFSTRTGSQHPIYGTAFLWVLLNPKWHMLMAIWAVREMRVYLEGSKYASSWISMFA